MPFKIVRNDITRMVCDAIVNTANEDPIVGAGCDTAVYTAAGFSELLELRRKIGHKDEGESFITPGLKLPAKYIIHTVSPLFIDGNSGEEEKLRNCYRNSLKLAADNGVRTIACPLISSGSFGYPKEEALRIAIDEVGAFLIHNQMLVYLVVFDEESTKLGRRIVPELEAYIDSHYVDERELAEYGRTSYPLSGMAPNVMPSPSAARTPQARPSAPSPSAAPMPSLAAPAQRRKAEEKPRKLLASIFNRDKAEEKEETVFGAGGMADVASIDECAIAEEPVFSECTAADFDYDFESAHGSKLQERMSHMADTFSEYLLYLIESKGMKNSQVYKDACVDKKLFSKIKNNKDSHPQKITAMCLCVGAKLNMDETRDLLARAGYALSPCDKRDVIFSYFIEHKIYDIIELDLQLEAHDLPCLIE